MSNGLCASAEDGTRLDIELDIFLDIDQHLAAIDRVISSCEKMANGIKSDAQSILNSVSSTSQEFSTSPVDISSSKNKRDKATQVSAGTKICEIGASSTVGIDGDSCSLTQPSFQSSEYFKVDSNKGESIRDQTSQFLDKYQVENVCWEDQLELFVQTVVEELVTEALVDLQQGLLTAELKGLELTDFNGNSVAEDMPGSKSLKRALASSNDSLAARFKREKHVSQKVRKSQKPLGLGASIALPTERSNTHNHERLHFTISEESPSSVLTPSTTRTTFDFSETHDNLSKVYSSCDNLVMNGDSSMGGISMECSRSSWPRCDHFCMSQQRRSPHEVSNDLPMSVSEDHTRPGVETGRSSEAGVDVDTCSDCTSESRDFITDMPTIPSQFLGARSSPPIFRRVSEPEASLQKSMQKKMSMDESSTTSEDLNSTDIRKLYPRSRSEITSRKIEANIGVSTTAPFCLASAFSSLAKLRFLLHIFSPILCGCCLHFQFTSFPLFSSPS